MRQVRQLHAVAIAVTIGLALPFVPLQVLGGTTRAIGAPSHATGTARTLVPSRRLAAPRPAAARFVRSTAGPAPTYYLAINAAGGGAANFAADSGYSGVSNTDTVIGRFISTSNLSNPAPQAVYQSERYGNFTYTIPGLQAGAAYAVRLHFAEIYWHAPGQRIFNVAINGRQVLSNFDIFTAAGGTNKAVIEQATASADGSGQIVITFTSVADYAKVNGIEVLPAYTPGSNGAPRYVNAGAGAVGLYSADTGYLGTTSTSVYSTNITTSGTSNAAPLPVYESSRFGNAFTYTFGGLTPGAGYAVRLHFAELWYRAAGARVFNVTLNGVPVLSDFDIYANVGGNTALVESYPATANTAGQIVVGFTSVKSSAKISGLEVEPGSQTAPSPQPSAPPAQTTDIPTQHVDALRSGWNPYETALTPQRVSASFGLLRTIPLDEQVDAQPLVVSTESIAGGTHNVVYVATENDSVYALDALSGEQLWRRSFGTPVPLAMLPGGCNNNSNNIGITSTPVIDRSTNTMYVLADALENGSEVYRLHAIDLSSGNDKLASQVVSAAHLLSDGATTYRFSAHESRARAALLEAYGNVYAAFSSYCDVDSDFTRGWVLGWSATTLAPLPANDLTDRRLTAPSQRHKFLSTIWMSGNGPAADGQGNLYYVTGNSDVSGTTYGADNIEESAVKQPADLSRVLGLFTPSNLASLDVDDVDFGAGGIMLLPDQAGPIPHLATAAGKDGRLFLLNRDALGGYTPGGPDNVLGAYNIEPCWCSESYFTGADGIGRVVSSGGNGNGVVHVRVWKVQTSPASLAYEGVSASLASGQDGGFFTTVSSNGTRAGTALIWGVGRPLNSNPATVTLYAIDPSTLGTIFSAPAGTWPHVTGNANIFPVVADGNVYVASYRNLSIFGLR